MGVGVYEIQINEITFEMTKKRASSIHYLYKKNNILFFLWQVMLQKLVEIVWKNEE